MEHPVAPAAGFGLSHRKSFAELVADEEAAVTAGQAQGCGHSGCDCHSQGAACIRADHPDEEHNRVPHVARLADGTLTQWTGPCPPEVDPELQAQLDAEAEAHAAARRAERQELFTDLFAAIGAHKERTGKLPWD